MKMRLGNSTRSRQRGFSLIELLVVMSIALVVAAFAVPYMVTVTANVRLRSAMTSMAGLMQDSRSLAIKNNQLMTTRFSVLGNGPVAYLKVASSTAARNSKDPQVQLGAPVTFVRDVSGITGAPTALDNSILSFGPNTTDDPTFNPRGLPCLYASGTCTSSVGFVYYFTDTRSLGKNGWAAVSVSPAGRIKVWFWNGTSWGG